MLMLLVMILVMLLVMNSFDATQFDKSVRTWA